MECGSLYIENHTKIKWLYNLERAHYFLLALKKIWVSCCSLEICYCRYARYMFANLKVSTPGVNFDKLRHIYTKRIQLSCPLHLFDAHIGMSYVYAFIYVVQLKPSYLTINIIQSIIWNKINLIQMNLAFVLKSSNILCL